MVVQPFKGGIKHIIKISLGMRVHHIYVLEFQIIQCMYLTKRRILRILIKVKTKNPSWFFKARLARQYMTFKPSAPQY